WLAGQALKVSYLWTGPEGQVTEGLRTELPARVEPGEVVELAARVQPPEAPRAYTLAIRTVPEGEAWIAREAGEPLRVTVGPSALEWELVSVAWPGRLDAARTDAITVRVRNTGAETWSPAAGDRLSYRWRAAEGAPLQ